MNSTVTYSQSELAHPAPRSARTSLRLASLTRYQVQEIVSDVAMVVAVLAFVFSLVALRLTLFSPYNVGERVVIPMAETGAAVFVLALVISLALRLANAQRSTR
jgi:hypothetical protein